MTELGVVAAKQRVKGHPKNMHIAIASSGLGHVARGIETWAEDTARALWERGRDAEEEGEEHPTSNIEHPTSNGRRTKGGMDIDERTTRDVRHPTPDTRDPVRLEVTLFAGGRVEDTAATPAELFAVHCLLPAPLRCVVLSCLRRSSRLARFLAHVSPGFTWRWGFKSAYGWEQFTFWRRLEPELRRGGFDILHVQDPMLAFWCRRARQAGRLRTQEILAHGTEESVEFLSQFEYVQHLTPWHLADAKRGREWRIAECRMPNEEEFP